VIRQNRQGREDTVKLYQRNGPAASARWLFEHVFDDAEGYMVTFTGQQARLTNPGARDNELTRIEQRSFPYPGAADAASSHLVAKAETNYDCYFGVHLFRERGSRLASNATPTVGTLWLDEDEGEYPDEGPEPTAIVCSSARRRHLYWRVSHPVSVEWAVTMNRRIAAWSGGDIGKAGLASVLRVPGTRNFKRHPQVDPVTLQITGADVWDPELLEQATPLLPETATTKRCETPYDGPRIELLDFLEDAAAEVVSEVPDELGVKLAVVCPWIDEHSGRDRTGTYVGQLSNGALWFHCHHEHCFGRGWHEFRLRTRRLKKKSHLIKEGEYFG